MLLEEFDRETNAIINPDMCAERIEDFPEVTISCFSWMLFDSMLAAFEARKIAEIHSATGLNPVYEVEYKGKPKESELQLITTYQHKNYFQDLFLLCKDIELSKVVLQPEETIDAKWATEETILQMIENGEFVHSAGQRFKEYKGETQPSGELGSTEELLYSNAGKV